MSILNISNIDGWEKDHWKITETGNWSENLAKNKNDIKIWLTNPGGDYYSIKIGKSKKLDESTYVATRIGSREVAIAKAIEFMKKNPTIKYVDEYPSFVDENGDRYNNI
jgi:hypothetical protein